ncbi:hypothetical protein Q0P93_15160, partial [Staphylococcus aureus]|nr:hypothetical protein [Staphylococcus aureus]
FIKHIHKLIKIYIKNDCHTYKSKKIKTSNNIPQNINQNIKNKNKTNIKSDTKKIINIIVIAQNC